MVFESIVVDILNRLLGDYFVALDTSQLKLGIWGGDVVLRELHLKHSVMDDLGLPFKVVVGTVGTLRMKIPWQALYTSPVELNLQNLLLIVTPSYSVKYNEAAEAAELQAAKEKELTRLDEIRARERLKQQGEQTQQHEDSFSEKLITQIIKNVQIRIDGIHIRYEDDVTKPASPFGFGIILKNLHIETTDEDWKPAVITEIVETVNKMATLEGLAVYWNSNTQLLQRQGTRMEMIEALKDCVVTENKNLGYILGPISSVAKVLLTPNPERSAEPFSKPKFWVDLVMEQLSLGITNLQFEDIMELVESLDLMTRAQYYRKYRPAINAHKGHYKEWWMFAYTAIVEEEVRRKRQNWDWLHVKRHRDLCRTYTDAYYKKLTQAKLKSETVLILQTCERELDVFNITLVRKQVEVKIEREGKAQAAKQQSGGWFSGWSWSGGGGKTSAVGTSSDPTMGDLVQKFEEALTPAEKAKLYAAIDYTENLLPLDYPASYEDFVLGFRLNKLVLTVREGLGGKAMGNTILNMEIDMVEATATTRPVKNGMKVKVLLASLEANGLRNKISNTPVGIVTSKIKTENSNLLEVFFENNPLDSQATQRIKVTVQPIEIVYHGKTVIQLAKCFTLPQELQLKKLQAAAMATLNEWREQSASGLLHMINTRGEVDLDVEFIAPYFLIPRDGNLKPQSTSVLVVDLGELNIKSKPRDRNSHKSEKFLQSHEDEKEEDYLKRIKKFAYDTLLIELRDFQVLIALPGEEFVSAIGKDKLTGRGATSVPQTLFKSSRLLLQLDQSLIPDDPRFPKLQLEANLPKLDIDLPEHRLIELVKLLVTLPIPQSDVPSSSASTGSGSTATMLSTVAEDPTVSHSYAITKITYGDTAVNAKPKKTMGEFIELLLKFTVDSIHIRINRVNDLREQLPFVDFELKHIQTKLTNKTFSTAIDVAIGGLTLSGLQKLRAESMSAVTPDSVRPLYLIRTLKAPKGQDSLLHIHIFTTSPDCPTSQAATIKQHVIIDIASMATILHREVLLDIVDFVDHLSAHVAQELSNVKLNTDLQIEDRKRKKSDKLERRQKSAIELHTQALAKKFGGDPNEILLKVEARLNNFTLLVATKQKNIMQVAMSNLSASFIQRPQKAEIFAQLVKFEILNLDPLSSYKKIVSVEADRVMSIHIVDYTESTLNTITDTTLPPDLTQCDIRIKIETGSPKVHILSSIMFELIDFSNQFQTATRAVKMTSAAAAEVAKKNVQQAYGTASRILLNVELRAPKIFLPENDHSSTAIVFDFGNLNFSNSFASVKLKNKSSSKFQYAIIDEMKIGLKNVKISRVSIDPESQESSCEILLLDPVSFTGSIRRNLSSDWYQGLPSIGFKGILHSTVIRLSSEDYEVVMGCMLDKIATMGKVPQSQTQNLDVKDIASAASNSGVGSVALKQTHGNFEMETMSGLSFSLDVTLNNLGAVLYKGSSRMAGKTGLVERDPGASLANFLIDSVVASAEVSHSDQLKCSVTLGNIDLQDSRPSRETVGGITNLIQRRLYPNSTPSSVSLSSKPMIQFSAEKSSVGTNVNLTTTSLTFLLCLDHVVQIMKFLNPSYRSSSKRNSEDEGIKGEPKFRRILDEARQLEDLRTPSSLKLRGRKNSSADDDEESKPFNAHFKLEAMEFIFVETMDNIQTNAVLLNFEMSLDVNKAESVADIVGVIDGVQLNTCNFNPEHRSQSLAEVISPITVTIVGKDGFSGLELEVSVSDIFARLSAGTVSLLSKISESFSVSPSAAEDIVTMKDYSTSWDKKPVSSLGLWYLEPSAVDEQTCSKRDKPEGPNKFAEEDVIMPDIENSQEKLLFKSGSIVLTFEAGSEVITAPLLLIEAAVDFQAVNWSKQLEMGGKVQVAAAYFNAAAGVWEYLLEPVSQGKYHSSSWKPLELLFSVNKGETDEFSSLLKESASSLVCIHSDEYGEGIRRGSEIVCTFQCVDIIEFTLTRMSVHVLQMLGNTFQAARKTLASRKEISTAPYIVENFTGIDIRVDLANTPFMAEFGTVDSDSVTCLGLTKRFKLHTNTQVELQVAKDSNRYSILKEHQSEEIRWIYVTMAGLQSQIKLPVSKAEIRCFPLTTGDNLTTEVWVNDCSRIVTFRGAVQVSNDLSVDVDILTSDLRHIATIPSDRKIPFSIPLEYLKSGSFVFAPMRYKTSIESFELPAQQGASKMTRFLSCPSYAGNNMFYIKVVSRSQQMLLETKKQYSLTNYNYEIRLEPTFLVNNMLPVPIAYLNSVGEELDVAERGKMIQVTNLPANAPTFELPLRVKGYDGLNWDCRVVIVKKTEKLSAWTFLCATEGRTLTLGIHKDVSATDNQFILHIYAPFWMINRTGLNLSYKGESEKQFIRHEVEKSIVLFSYPQNEVFNKSNKARMKPDEADWCAAFPTETVGLSSFLSCKSAKKDYQFGISIKICHGGLTKMIIFTPKYYIMNQCSYAVSLVEGSETEELSLAPSVCAPFWPKAADPRLKVGVSGTAEMSQYFHYETGHSTLLKLDSNYGGIHVDINVGNTRIVITLSEYCFGKAPNMIINVTDDLTIGYRQEGQDLSSQSILLPSECQLVCWPEPTKNRILNWYPLTANATPSGQEFQDAVVADSFMEFQCTNDRGETGKYFWISYIEDVQRVTVLTKNEMQAKFLKTARDYELPTLELVLTLSGIGVSLVDNERCKELVYLRMSSTGLIWEQEIARGKLRPFSNEESTALEGMYQAYTNVKLEGEMRGDSVGVFRLDNGMEVDIKTMQITSSNNRALRRCPKQPGFWTHVKVFPHSTQCHLKINRLQIDNQLPDATFVFLLTPVAVAKSVTLNESESRKPFVELVFMQEKKAHSSNIEYIYCSFLVQEFQVKMDVGLISAIVEMFSEVGDAKVAKIMEDFRNDYSSAVMSIEDHQKKTVVSVGSKKFYNYLQLSPLKIKVSFSMNGSTNESSNVFLVLLQGLGIDKLADFQDVLFQLACFELQNKLLSDDQLGRMVTSHYTAQGLKQFYVLILGLDFLGNPYALFTGITEGIGSFFYEPIQGAILGPEEFKEGLSLGVKSLVGHTVGGAAEALSKVTGTIGKGFAAMTMDNDFQRQRNEAMRQGPQATSFANTARGFFKTGIVDTVTGLVTNPIKGAQEEGLQGFGKGLLRGVVGIVTRPVAGAADFTRGTLDSFRRALQDGDELDQVRPPRPVQCSSALRPYNLHAGQGYQIMMELARKGRGYLKSESYITHLVVENLALVVTDRRAFFLKLTDSYGSASVTWEHLWKDFEDPPSVVERGIEFQLKPPPGSKPLAPFAQPNRALFLYVPVYDPQVCMWILKEVTEVMNSDREVETLDEEDD